MLFYSRGIGEFIYVDGVSPDHQWEPSEKYMEEYRHPVEKEYTPRPRTTIRGHGGGQRTTPLSWHRLFEALVEQRVTDFDVYDSVTSSVISPLSEMSVANGSEPVEFPDFTKGRWKERLPVEVAYERARG